MQKCKYAKSWTPHFPFWTPHFVIWNPHFGWTPRLNYTVVSRFVAELFGRVVWKVINPPPARNATAEIARLPPSPVTSSCAACMGAPRPQGFSQGRTNDEPRPEWLRSEAFGDGFFKSDNTSNVPGEVPALAHTCGRPWRPVFAVDTLCPSHLQVVT